jgi:hypothetical protein
MMSCYCAPLKDLPKFEWPPKAVNGITVLRHTVDRVWSMFHFQTRACFQCTPLLEIHNRMDNHTTSTDLKPNCLDQLQNHEVANWLSTDWDDEASDDDDLLNEAIANLKTFFTDVGLTEELNTTVQIAGRAFPWMQNHVMSSRARQRVNCPMPMPRPRTIDMDRT